MPQTISPPITQRSPYLFWGSVALLGLAAILTLRWFTRERVTIRVAPASLQNLESSTSTNGKVEPIHEFQAHAAAPGVVQRLYVGVGDKVSVGTLLVKMDDSDVQARLASSQLSVSTAKLGLATTEQNGSQEERLAMAGDIDRTRLQQQQAANDLAALRQLQQKGAASAGEVASAQERLNTITSTLNGLIARSKSRYSGADLDHAKQQVANAQAEQAAAQHSYAAANIRSPIAGTVYDVPVSEYDYVPAGEDLMDIADLNHIQIRAYFDEPEIGKLAEGQPVKIVWDARPNKVWHGHIEQVPTDVKSYGTRNVGECVITVDDARGDLLPNTNVTVTVTTAQKSNALSVPREALHTNGAQNYVYRVAHGKLVRTPVQLGVVNLTRVEITFGLSAGDTVALSATSNRDLTNGMPVKIAE
jgi:HlyD family secretion protein